MPHQARDPVADMWTPSARRTMAGFVVGLAVMVVLYRWLVSHDLEQSSALFLGLPTALAATVALLVRPRSAVGSLTAFLVISMLASGPLLGEGFVCVLMASPLVLLVALIIGCAYQSSERGRQQRLRRQRRTGRRLPVVVLPLLLMSGEGVVDGLSFERAEVVVVVKHVDASVGDVEAVLARTPDLWRPLPAFLRLGFPQPVAASGEGLQVGDERCIRFAGGEGSPGDLVLRVHARGPGQVVFRAESDDSHIAHWLDWKLITVRWAEHETGGTQVTWELRYDRLLDPAWYFGPLQRLAVRLVGEQLHACLIEDGVRLGSES